MMSSSSFEILPEFTEAACDNFKNARKPAPKWALLDFDWRRERYGRRIPQKRGRDRFFWYKRGWENRQSPNLFFDTAFYVTDFRVKNGLQAKTPLAFYLQEGLAATSPHWLFSEKDYFFLNPTLSKADFTFDSQIFPEDSEAWGKVFLNGYDHFCLKGDLEKCQPHRFFVPGIFIENLKKAQISLEIPEDFEPWAFFLKHASDSQISLLPTSWHFDPKWYLETYPDIAEAIQNQKFLSPLHHYLTNETPTKFNPSPYFCEQEYLALHPDVQGAIDAGVFRNAYDHFLICGESEGRAFLIDKGGYPRNIFHFVQNNPQTQEEMAALKADDLFSLYIAYKKLGKNFGELPKPSEKIAWEVQPLKEDGQLVRLSQARQEALFSVLSRSPLKIFTDSWELDKKPYLSVVLFSRGDYAALIRSIESLVPFLKQGTELLIISSGNAKETEIVQRFVKGEMRFVHLLKTQGVLDFWQAALENVRGTAALWLEAGLCLKSANPDMMMSALDQHDCAAFSGLIQKGTMYQLGGKVLLDGSLRLEQIKDEKREDIFQGEQEIDLPAEGMLLCNVSEVRSVFHKISEVQKIKDRIVWTGLSDFESLALSLREDGRKIIFSPSFFAQADGKLSLPTRESHLARWRRKVFPRLLLQEKSEQISLILDELPQAGSMVFYQIKSLVESGFSVHLLALQRNSKAVLERFLDFGRKISWEENPDNRDLAFLKYLENSDLTWLVGMNPLKEFLDFWKKQPKEPHILSPCLVDVRFEAGTDILDKAILKEIEANPLIDTIAISQEGDFPILDKFSELQQLILPFSKITEGRRLRSSDIEKLRFIFDRSRQDAIEIDLKKSPVSSEKKSGLSAPRRPLKLLDV